MKRSDLVNALKNTAENLGYNFFSGPEASIPISAKLPAVWLTAPALKSASGTRERKDTYEIKLFIIQIQNSSLSTDNTLHKLESDADSLLHSLLKLNFVRKIDKLKTKHSPKPLTINGDLSLAVEADVQLSYYNY